MTDDTKAKIRTLNLLKTVDSLIGSLKKEQNKEARSELNSTLKWINKNLSVNKLDKLFQDNKQNFEHIRSLRDILSIDKKAGLSLDIIDRIVFYREAGDFGQDLEEILRFERDGTTYWKGNLVFRDKSLYSDLALILD